MDLWQKRAQRTAQGNQLGYETKKDGVTIGLLRKPSIEPWDEFTCLNSLRDVEPTANLILDDFGTWTTTATTTRKKEAAP